MARRTFPRVGLLCKQLAADMPHQVVRTPEQRNKRHTNIRPPSTTGKAGAPSIYDPIRFPHMANTLCKEYGFTSNQMAKVFGVSPKTVQLWMMKYPEFKEAVWSGKDEFDSVKVENALLKVALGFEYDERTVKSTHVRGVDAEGNKIRVPAKEITVTTKMLTPNVKAIALWLTNRQPERWKNSMTVTANVNSKTEHTEKTLSVTADLSSMNREQLKALRELVSTQKTDEVEMINNGEGTLLLEMIDKGRDIIEAEVAEYIE
jgi:hypothetical protein